MTTKPEGPAQEPEAVCCFNCPYMVTPGHVCTNCGKFNPLPATPTQSQPAAREWLERYHGDLSRLEWPQQFPLSVLIEYLEAYAHQQTAAKDAEISEARRLISEYIDTINSFDALGSVAARDRLRAFMKGKPARNHRAEAAERERDSLREALRFCRDVGTALPLDSLETAVSIIKNVRGKAERTLAALKAGKDEHGS